MKEATEYYNKIISEREIQESKFDQEKQVIIIIKKKNNNNKCHNLMAVIVICSVY